MSSQFPKHRSNPHFSHNVYSQAVQLLPTCSHPESGHPRVNLTLTGLQKDLSMRSLFSGSLRRCRHPLLSTLTYVPMRDASPAVNSTTSTTPLNNPALTPPGSGPTPLAPRNTLHAGIVGRPRDLATPRRQHIKMTRHASVKAVKFADLAPRYGAMYFRDALSRFVVQHNHPELTTAQQERAAASIYFHFNKIPAYHKVKFWLEDPHGLALPGTELCDVVHCRPTRKNKHGDDVPGRFNTALVRISGSEDHSIHCEFASDAL